MGDHRVRRFSSAYSINTDRPHTLGDTVRSLDDNTAIEELSNEVIVLSTRNANLEEKLEEMRTQIERNLDVLDPDNLSIEIPIDILDIDSEFEYLMRINENKQLFLLLNYLKTKGSTDTIHRIVAMEVFRAYYDGINLEEEEEEQTTSKDPELKAVYTFCTNQLNVPSAKISNIDDIVRKSSRIQQRIGIDIFE